jgi:hypothetical protein
MTDDRQTILNHFAGNFRTFYEKYLPNLKPLSGGKEFQTLCPFHDDSIPSFNFNVSSGQYYCHGCGKKGDIFHFYAKISDLNSRSDYPKIIKGIARDFGISVNGQKKARLIKTYPYHDPDGKLLFEVCRMDPKDFRQRRPNGNGGWIWNLKGIEPVLYRLPHVMNASEVILVEGEKDADNLSKLGFCATTCPMGANKWRESYSGYLKNKNIILIPDNDLAGREHMTKIAVSINGNSASLKWIDLPRVPDKGDISDFINTFHNPEEAAERLSIMIENATAYEPPKVLTIDDLILNVQDFSRIDIPMRDEYLTPWLKEGSINLISGWRGTGKTFLALSILDAVSSGENLGPWECLKPACCLFLDGEMPVQDIIERSQNLKLNRERPNPLYIYCDALMNQHGLPRAHLSNEIWRQKIKQILLTKKIKVWVIDNLASLAGGLDENAKKEWDPINQFLLELRFSGISTIMLHHTNKDGGQRGTSAREDNIDTSIILKSPYDYSPEDGARFILHFSKARVRTKDLSLISDIEFKLIQEESGRYLWVYGNVRAKRNKEILRLLDEGIQQKEAAEILKISKGQISKVRKKAIDDGWLTEKNKLTQSGFLYVSED